MANQPQRPWFRLPSIARQAPTTGTTAQAASEPPPPQPRPAVVRAPFRPVAQPQPVPTLTQEPPILRSPPPPPAATLPPAAASPPPPPATLPPAAGVSSVPQSPAPRAIAPSSSLPTSPALSAPPVFTGDTFSVPSSPKTSIVATTSSVPSSPALRVPPSRGQDSPRTIRPAVQTPPESPKPKPTAPPPSPLTLPPSQFKSEAEHEPKIPPEAEQKMVLVQKTIDRKSDAERGFKETGIDRLGKQEPFKDVEARRKDHRKKFISSDYEEGGMRVITIAGENKGAFMEVILPPKKNVFHGKSHHLKKTIGDSGTDGNISSSSSSSGEEGKPKKKGIGRQGNHQAMGSHPTSTFMNSNVQGVNNSIVYNSTCTHRDPGVHLSFSRKPAGGGAVIAKDRGNGYQS